MLSNVTVIIPSLNPDEKLKQVVDGLREKGFKDILLINDGSDNNHLEPFYYAAGFPECEVLTHEVNKGKGRALKTAFKHILDTRKDIVGVVTVDGDNQHLPDDIVSCVAMMKKCNNKVILGARDFSGDDVPPRSKFGNNLTRRVFRIFCGIKITDTQTGLRAIPKEYLKLFCDIKGERYEYETNMLLEMKEFAIEFEEVRISTVYIEDNMSSHFNPIKDSIKIYKTIFKFMLSSLVASLVDIGLFAVFLILFKNFIDDKLATTISAVLARVVSSLTNYTVNKKAVFGCNQKGSNTIVKYYSLAVCQMLASVGLLQLVKMAFSITNSALTVLAKAIVDTILFFISFRIQQQWVFKKKK